MTQERRQIVSGSAWFKEVNGKTILNPTAKYCLQLTKKNRPKLCYIGTARGDALESIEAFYEASSCEDVSPSHLQLFPQPNQDIRRYLMEQDVIWVDWGSVANLLAVWRVHKIDEVLKEAWEQGVILSGVSAGSICWGIGGTTDSFGSKLKPIKNALGLLPYSIGVHYDSEEKRRPLFQKLINKGSLPAGYATDDGVSLHFIGSELHKAITEVEGKFAYHVYKNASGKVIEDKITPELLT